MGSQEAPGQSPAEVLAQLGKQLTQQHASDIELAEILKAHILNVTPAKDAVGQAMAAIRKLAAERAKPSKAEGADD